MSTTDKFFLLWEPTSSLPPTKRFDSRKQADAVADKMSREKPGKTFYVLEAVAGHLASYNVSAFDLGETAQDRVAREVEKQRAAFGGFAGIDRGVQPAQSAPAKNDRARVLRRGTWWEVRETSPEDLKVGEFGRYDRSATEASLYFREYESWKKTEDRYGQMGCRGYGAAAGLKLYAIRPGSANWAPGDEAVFRFPYKSVSDGARVRLLKYDPANTRWDGEYLDPPRAGMKWSYVQDEYIKPSGIAATMPVPSRTWGPGFVKTREVTICGAKVKGAVFRCDVAITVPNEAEYVLFLGDSPDSEVQGLMALKEAAGPYRHGTPNGLRAGYRIYCPVKE